HERSSTLSDRASAPVQCFLSLKRNQRSLCGHVVRRH
ncbi:hypothetical protein, partial [Cowpea mosaic virus]